MRRLLAAVAFGLALAPAAGAAAPAVTLTATASGTVGLVTVTLTASGDPAAYRWDFGDGSPPATGAVVRHAFVAGTWTVVVTATGASGETAQASTVVTVQPHAVTLESPAAVRYASRAVFRGRVVAGWGGVPVQIYRGRTFVARTETRTGGAYSVPVLLRTPGRYHARFGRTRSAEREVRVVPTLTVTVPSTVPIGTRMPVRVRMKPTGAGRIEIVANGRMLRGWLLRTPDRPGVQRLVVRLVPRPGYSEIERRAKLRVVLPELGPGSRGAAVRELERMLREQRYVLRAADDRWDLDTTEAVYAFQAVHGLRRTGRVTAGLWRRIAAAHVPRPRYRGTHIEVSKGRQYLFDVRGGLVVRVVHVSTGATGNTPLGTWRVYRKVPGFDWVLYYPMYFLRGFAIHGYPSVPPYPASHGCVRVPMWIAQTLYNGHGYGSTVHVYW